MSLAFGGGLRVDSDAVQDLTPQLRTRLDRVERAVGVFVLLAVLVLVAGFAFYIYHTAQRKGWFKTQVAYCTSLDSAAGLKLGDPVKLMGFDVGEITRIDTLPPDDLFNVYVEFKIRSPYFGYLWTRGTRVRVSPADFLGNRFVEVTKGTNYMPIHLVWTIRELPPREAAGLPNLSQVVFLDALEGPGGGGRLTVPMQPLDTNALHHLAEAGVPMVRVADRQASTKHVTAVWNQATDHYDAYTARTKPYWLPPEESPALTERLDHLVRQAEEALPGILVYTNQLATVLSNAAQVTASTDGLLLQARSLVTNLTEITGTLAGGDGALGRWLLPEDLYAQTLLILGNANGALTNATITFTNAGSLMAAANTNLVFLASRLDPPLQSLSLIISNLNAQVQVNTNFVSTLHSLLEHTDGLIEGLKRHWLFRGAFKTNTPAEPRGTAPKFKRYTSPKGGLR